MYLVLLLTTFPMKFNKRKCIFGVILLSPDLVQNNDKLKFQPQ